MKSIILQNELSIEPMYYVMLQYITCSTAQNICASSCWKRRTLVNPVNAPDSSLRCNTPKSANRNGSSLQDLDLISNIKLKIIGTRVGNILDKIILKLILLVTTKLVTVTQIKGFMNITLFVYDKENLERQETNKYGRGTVQHLPKTDERVVRPAGERH